MKQQIGYWMMKLSLCLGLFMSLPMNQYLVAAEQHNALNAMDDLFARFLTDFDMETSTSGSASATTLSLLEILIGIGILFFLFSDGSSGSMWGLDSTSGGSSWIIWIIVGLIILTLIIGAEDGSSTGSLWQLRGEQDIEGETSSWPESWWIWLIVILVVIFLIVKGETQLFSSSSSEAGASQMKVVTSSCTQVQKIILIALIIFFLIVVGVFLFLLSKPNCGLPLMDTWEMMQAQDDDGLMKNMCPCLFLILAIILAIIFILIIAAVIIGFLIIVKKLSMVAHKPVPHLGSKMQSQTASHPGIQLTPPSTTGAATAA